MGLRRALLSVVCVSWVGCSGSAPSPATPTGTESNRDSSGACSERLAATGSPVAPKPVAAPVSRLGVEVRVPIETIDEALRAQVPATVAQANRQPVGAAGRATYTVTRGKASYDVKGDDLIVTLPLNAEISVCKPIGSLCIGYGRCSPRFNVTTQLPLRLDARGKASGMKMEVVADRACRIAGVDVTPRLLSEARDQADSVRKDIARHWKLPEGALDQAWAKLRTPLPAGPGACLRLDPERLIQHEPKREADALVWRASLEGRAEMSTCSDKTQDPASAEKSRPVLETGPADVWPPNFEPLVEVPWTDVTSELMRALTSGSPGRTRVTSVEATATGTLGAEAAASATALFLRLNLEGELCGEAHFASDIFGGSGAGPKLNHSRPLEPTSPKLSEFAKILDAAPPLTLDTKPTEAVKSAAAWLDRLADQRVEVSVESSEPSSPAFMADARALWAATKVPLVLRVDVK
jgi:hypothetical protein